MMLCFIKFHFDVCKGGLFCLNEKTSIGVFVSPKIGVLGITLVKLPMHVLNILYDIISNRPFGLMKQTDRYLNLESILLGIVKLVKLDTSEVK